MRWLLESAFCFSPSMGNKGLVGAERGAFSKDIFRSIFGRLFEEKDCATLRVNATLGLQNSWGTVTWTIFAIAHSGAGAAQSLLPLSSLRSLVRPRPMISRISTAAARSPSSSRTAWGADTIFMRACWPGIWADTFPGTRPSCRRTCLARADCAPAIIFIPRLQSKGWFGHRDLFAQHSHHAAGRPDPQL